MPQMIRREDELIRISPDKRTKLQYSTNDGRSWHTRFYDSSRGDFEDLIDNGDEILAQTSKGLYYSKNEGKSWHRRN